MILPILHMRMAENTEEICLRREKPMLRELSRSKKRN
jgi:hypothetical protein